MCGSSSSLWLRRLGTNGPKGTRGVQTAIDFWTRFYWTYLVKLRGPDAEAETVLREAVPVGELPPDYVKAIGKDTLPGLVPPFKIDATTARPKFAIVDITKWEPEGELTYEDVKDKMRTQLSQQLAVKAYIRALRRTTHVAILQ